MAANKPAADSGRVIRLAVNPVQKDVRNEWVEMPNTQPEGWGGIFCGWASDGPWIFEVDISGSSQFHDRFAATGSGHPVAHTALMSVSHFNVERQSLEAAKAIAYRAIENTCQSSGAFVEMPVQMAVVTAAGVEEINLGDPQHTELRDLIDLWKSKEVETLGALAPQAGAGEPPAASEEPPTPSIDESEIDAAASS